MEERWVAPFSPLHRPGLSLPYNPALSQASCSRDNVGIPGVGRVLFHQATAPATLMGMCKRTRLYLAHDSPFLVSRHFRQEYALVYTRTLKRAASQRPMVRLLSVRITPRRPALIPIVPYGDGAARVGLAPIIYVSRRGECPTHGLENAPARRTFFQNGM